MPVDAVMQAAQPLSRSMQWYFLAGWLRKMHPIRALMARMDARGSTSRLSLQRPAIMEASVHGARLAQLTGGAMCPKAATPCRA